MPEKKQIVLLVATIFCILVTILVIIKGVLISNQIQYLTEGLASIGTTFEEHGVNSSLGYVSVALSIIVGIVSILACLVTMKDIEVNNIKIGPVVLLAMVIFFWIGIFIPLIDSSFTAGSYLIYVQVDLLESMFGVGDPIFLTVAFVLAALAAYRLS